jgi:hypothetical protein
MDFEPIGELVADPAATFVYEEGWQSCSPVGVHRATEASPRPPDRLRHTMGWRPGKRWLSCHGPLGEALAIVVDRLGVGTVPSIPPTGAPGRATSGGSPRRT